MERPVVWDGNYVKAEYLVHQPGECVKCWPNAGWMNAMDGSGRRWAPDGKLMVSRLDGKPVMEAEDKLLPADLLFYGPKSSPPQTWAELHLQERKRLKRERSLAKRKRR